MTSINWITIRNITGELMNGIAMDIQQQAIPGILKHRLLPKSTK